MTAHLLEPRIETVIDRWDRDAPAALTVASGDTVRVRLLDSEGYLEPISIPGRETAMLIGGHKGHCMGGPIAIEGALPGQMLAVTFLELIPESWGWTAAATGDGWLNRRLGLRPENGAHLLWSIDSARGIATSQLGIEVSTRPFLGVVGVPPAAPGRHSTFPPRGESGGNLDCKELVVGSTLYLPVTVPGALLCLGDGHAAQGDGEASGTAIECGMDTTIRVELLDSARLSVIHAETPAGKVTFGFDENLNEAMAQALEHMVEWIAGDFELARSEALALASVAADLRVTQVANGTWGVHAVLPHEALRRSATSA